MGEINFYFTLSPKNLADIFPYYTYFNIKLWKMGHFMFLFELIMQDTGFISILSFSSYTTLINQETAGGWEHEFIYSVPVTQKAGCCAALAGSKEIQYISIC
jgi:hypothetical protein